MPLPPDQLSDAAKGYWGSVTAAVRSFVPGQPRGYNVQQVWGSIYAHQIEYGLPNRPTLQEVNSLYSLASGYYHAEQTLARTDPAMALTSSMMAPTIDSRSETYRALAERFDIFFEVTRAGPEGSVSEWRSWRGLGELPATVGELYDMIDAQVGLEADKYGWAAAGVTSVSIAVM